MRTRIVAAVFAVLAVGGCGQPAEPADAPTVSADTPTVPAPQVSSYAATSDLSGYYMPMSEIRIGKWTFDHISVGQAADFRAGPGAEHAATFAPVMLQFKDETSPMVETELGETRSIAPRILPTRYEVSDDRIVFEGASPELGVVRFEGRIDQAVLRTSRREGGEEGVAVTGTLTAAGQTVKDVRLRWWMGD